MGLQSIHILPKTFFKTIVSKFGNTIEEFRYWVHLSLNAINNYQLIIDSIFGFSFKPQGGIRPPFNEVIQTVNKTSIPILSVDIPSGWDVDDGFVEGGLRNPDVLVSLTAPKPVANHISEKTQHYVGGRFIGPKFAKKYGIDQYDYRGYDQVLKLSKIWKSTISQPEKPHISQNIKYQISQIPIHQLMTHFLTIFTFP